MPRVEHMACVRRFWFSVDLIAQNRVADRLQMDPNLMSSPSKDLAKNEGLI